MADNFWPIPINPMALGADESTLPGGAGWENANLLPIQKNRKTGQWAWGMPNSLAAALSGVMAPGKAANGLYERMIDPTTGVNYYDGMLGDVSNLAGMLTLGGGAIPKPKGSLGIFGGEMALTADKTALETAKKMAADGANRDAIWNATGWFKGKDDKWRFEIPDNASKVNTNAASFSDESNNVPMSLAMKHDILFDAYPEMAELPASMRLRAGELEGSYMPPRTVGSRLIEGISVEAPTGRDLQSGMLHEGQHAVQTRENFAEGGTPDAMNIPRDDLFDAARQAYEENMKIDDDVLLAELLGTPVPKAKAPAKPWDSLSEREKLGWLQAGRERIYRLLAGEVESRNVQYRSGLTPEQRRAKAPWYTQDVPDELQIVRMRGN